MGTELPKKRSAMDDLSQGSLEEEIARRGSGSDHVRTTWRSSQETLCDAPDNGSDPLCGLLPKKKRFAKRQKRNKMGKFGFGKKDKSQNDSDDSSRASLFGRKKPASKQDDNPYAQQPVQDPYAGMTPYQQARANLAAGPQGPPSGPPRGPSPAASYQTPPPSYPGTPQFGGGYGNAKYGARGGYGGNRFDAGGPVRSGPSPVQSQISGRFPSRGVEGYGGLGPVDDDAKDQLLAGAKGRYVNQAASTSAADSSTTSQSATDYSGDTYATSGDYGEQRELTAEELETQDVKDINLEAKDIRRKDIVILDNLKRTMQQTIEIAEGTQMRLEQQEDRLIHSEKNLDTARRKALLAEGKTDELIRLNRSFLIPASSPFGRTKRLEREVDQIVDSNREHRGIKGETRSLGYRANQQHEQDFRTVGALKGTVPSGDANPRRDLRFIDEDADASDEEDEKKIRQSEAELLGQAKVLNFYATKQGETLDRSTKVIDRLAGKSDNLDDNITKLGAKMTTRFKV